MASRHLIGSRHLELDSLKLEGSRPFLDMEQQVGQVGRIESRNRTHSKLPDEPETDWLVTAHIKEAFSIAQQPANLSVASRRLEG